MINRVTLLRISRIFPAHPGVHIKHLPLKLWVVAQIYGKLYFETKVDDVNGSAPWNYNGWTSGNKQGKPMFAKMWITVQQYKLLSALHL